MSSPAFSASASAARAAIRGACPPRTKSTAGTLVGDEGLRHVGNPVAGRRLDVAVFGREVAEHGRKERGLAAAVGADEADALARRRSERRMTVEDAGAAGERKVEKSEHDAGLLFEVVEERFLRDEEDLSSPPEVASQMISRPGKAASTASAPSPTSTMIMPPSLRCAAASGSMRRTTSMPSSPAPSAMAGS